MYISIHRSGKNKQNEYVLLLEAYRAEDGSKRSRIVKNFGRLDKLLEQDPQALEKLKAKYSSQREAKKKATADARIESAKQAMSVSNETNPAGTPAPLLHFGHYPLSHLWDEVLGLTWKTDYKQKTSGAKTKFSISAAARHMACLKAMDPGCELFSYADKDDFLGDPLKGITPQDLCDTLIFLSEHKDKLFRWIGKKLNTKAENSQASLVIHDVTSIFYREAFPALPLQGTGTKWNHEEGTQSRVLTLSDRECFIPFAAIVLVVNQDGCPLDFEAYAGRQDEQLEAMKACLERMKHKYGIKTAVVRPLASMNAKAVHPLLQETGIAAMSAHIMEMPPQSPRLPGCSTANQNAAEYTASCLKTREASNCFRLMLGNPALLPADMMTPGHLYGHIALCVLSLLLLRLLQSELARSGTMLSLDEICSASAAASVCAVQTGGSFMFIHTESKAGFHSSGRASVGTDPDGRTNKRMTATEQAYMMPKGKSPVPPIAAIMKACALNPLPQICSLQELGTSLRTRFSSPADAIPAARRTAR